VNGANAVRRPAKPAPQTLRNDECSVRSH